MQNSDTDAPVNNHADPDGRRIPDFLGVGAQKAGTTWLWENLRLHRDFYLPHRKELHFLDRHWDKGYDWYLQHFARRRMRDRIAGEITPNYLVSDRLRVETMHAINPDLKAVILVREPVERAWSAARYFARNQIEKPIEDLTVDEFELFIQAKFVGERGDYVQGITLWEQTLGADQVHVSFYDDIQTRPVETFRTIVGFLGGNVDFDPEAFELSTVFNAGPSSSMPAQHRAVLAAHLAPQTEWLAERFGTDRAPWLAGAPSSGQSAETE